MDMMVINNYKGGFIKYSPEVLQVEGIVHMIHMTMRSNIPNRITICKVMYKRTGKKKYLVEYYRLTKPNNWLRMHGYPMRRS